MAQILCLRGLISRSPCPSQAKAAARENEEVVTHILRSNIFFHTPYLLQMFRVNFSLRASDFFLCLLISWHEKPEVTRQQTKLELD